MADTWKIAAVDPNPDRSVTGIECRAANLPSVEFVDEGLSFRGSFHHAVGEAHLVASDGTLSLLNTGTAGLDGVFIELVQDTERFEAQWVSIGDAARTSTGSSFRVTATGSLNGVSAQDLGCVFLEDAGPEIAVTVDYSPIGSMSQLIQVFNKGRLVGEVPGHTGPIGAIPCWPTGGGYLAGSDASPTLPGFVLDFGDEETLIEIDGGPTLAGNELRILAETAVDVEHIDGLGIQVGALPLLTITDEVLFPDAAPIPTVTEWGIFAMAALLTCAGAFLIRRRVAA